MVHSIPRIIPYSVGFDRDSSSNVHIEYLGPVAALTGVSRFMQRKIHLLISVRATRDAKKLVPPPLFFRLKITLWVSLEATMLARATA